MATYVEDRIKAAGKSPAELREAILSLVEQYAQLTTGEERFVPGTSPVRVSGKVCGAPEMRSLVDASLDLWLTTGRFNAAFESRLGEFLGLKHVLTVNSGSSANLVAFSALTSPLLRGRKMVPGDEVIAVGASFPTTVNPAIQHGMVPVFVDVDIPTYNIKPELIEQAVGPRTRAIMVAHTLGNPFDLAEVMRVAEKHNLWVVEDCCDALGATYDGRLVGTFGDIGTLSFYPAHHITMGEGGAVFTNRGFLRKAMESIRDWGRSCWCQPGKDNTCGQRFGWTVGELPTGYDHKYIYSHIGYNLKISDMQAAVGLAQLDRLDGFIDARRRNFDYLHEGLASLEEFFILPKATPRSNPSWFGFPITVRPNAPFGRDEVVRWLESKGIATRNLFAGNLVRQPYMIGRNYRLASSLENCDLIMTNTFWVGVFPGLRAEHLDYVIDQFSAFVKSR
ncbi:MAG: lipopolysaccharide biosynthesis protein RfbH [Hyphomicrobium sp.]